MAAVFERRGREEREKVRRTCTMVARFLGSRARLRSWSTMPNSMMQQEERGAGEEWEREGRGRGTGGEVDHSGQRDGKGREGRGGTQQSTQQQSTREQRTAAAASGVLK